MARIVRKRAATAELVGSLFAIVITLVAGTSVMSFMNGQAGASARQYGTEVQTMINALGERFSVVNFHFTCATLPCSGGFTQGVISIYNSGSIQLALYEIEVQDLTAATTMTFQATGPVALPPSCGGGGASPSVSTVMGIPNGAPPQPPTVRSFTLTLPAGGGCPTGLSGTFTQGHQYQIMALGVNGYQTQLLVSP